MRSFILLFLALLCPAFVFCQNTQVENLKEKGAQYYLAGKYDSAILMYEQARQVALETNDSTTYYSLATSITDNLTRIGQYDNAIATITPSLTTGKPYLEGLILAKTYRSIGNALSRGPGSDETARAYLDSAQSIVATIESSESTYQQSVLYNDIGIIYYQSGDFAETEKYFKAAIATVETLEMDEKVAGMAALLSNNVGAILKIRGANNEAIKYHRKAEDIAKKHLADPNGVLGFAYDGIASAIRNSREFSEEKALFYYEEALKILRTTGAPTDPVYTMHGIAQIYKNLGNYESSEKVFLEAKALSEKHLGPYDAKSIWSYTNLADLYRIMGQLELSYEYHELTINTLRSLSYLTSQPALDSFTELAYFAFLKEDYDEGYEHLNSFETVLNKLYGDGPASGSYYLVAADMLRSVKLYDSAMVNVDKALANLQISDSPNDALVYRAKRIKSYILGNEYGQTGNTEVLLKAYEYLLSADSMRSKLKGSQTMLKDQVYNQNNLLQWQKLGFRIAYNLSLEFDKPEYVRKAWEFMEFDKTALLLSNIQKSRNDEQINVPSEILTLEGDLTNSITYYETAKYNARQANDRLQFDNANKNLLVLSEKQDSLRDILSERYPNYYMARYEFEVRKISDIQSKMEADELMLNYFLSDTSVFVFEISKSDFELRRIKYSLDFVDNVADYVNKLNQPNFKVESAQELQDMGWNISRTILPEYEKLMAYKRLTIISAEFLTSLPFEVLPTSQKSEVSSFSQMDYLIKSHEISYANSATLLDIQNSGSASTASNSVVAFAPVFKEALVQESIKYDSSRAGMNELAYTESEIDQLAEYFSTELIKSEEATEQSFKALSQQHSIVHIASHGLIDANDPLFSKLVFSHYDQDSLNDGYLYTQELFNMNIDADMVVLSACNSGAGPTAGASIISLANGFFYAGSRSLVMSLWTANDQSTATIIGDFYESLAEKSSKSTALRKAKLNYLNEADNIRSHPYYWAHLVINGNNQPIAASSDLTIYFILIIVACIIIFAIKRRKAA